MRRRGVDAIAVKERSDLEGRDEDEVLRIATAEHRVVVTNNVRDFAPLVEDFGLRGQTQFGVLFTDDDSFPRSADRVGQLILALVGFADGKQDDWLLDGCMYLPAASSRGV